VPLLLVADIGGTNSRFGLLDADASPRPDQILAMPNDRIAAFEDAVAAYLDATPERPREAVLAVAGPVLGRSVRLTNRGWTIDADGLAARFGFERVRLVNDFVAQAASLPELRSEDMVSIGAAIPRDRLAKAAVGPGTGLGVAALLPVGASWLPVPSEGGHIELAATNPREVGAIEIIRRRFGRVSAEHALSGPGLGRLHAALAEIDGVAGETRAPREITAGAMAGEPRAIQTVSAFLRLLARFAGDVALMFGAGGGVYLCGGVAPKLLGLLDPAAFRAAFEAKSPHEALMRATATMVVTSEIAGLIGCAALARRAAG
jgi:glucokinase